MYKVIHHSIICEWMNSNAINSLRIRSRFLREDDEFRFKFKYVILRWRWSKQNIHNIYLFLFLFLATLCSVCDLSSSTRDQPGIPVPPALEGGVLTTGPRGRSLHRLGLEHHRNFWGDWQQLPQCLVPCTELESVRNTAAISLLTSKSYANCLLWPTLAGTLKVRGF